MLNEFFGWLDAHPAFYWVVASLASALFAAWIGFSFSARGRNLSRRRHAGMTGLLLLAVLLAWRWPPLLFNGTFNPDEAQFVAGAITLGRDPVFWRSVDVGTSGPLNIYALLPTHWLGIPQDFFNARLDGLLLVWGALWAGYALLRREYGPALAVAGLIPGVAFFATVTDNDFIHYSSEHLSLTLMMISAWLLWTAHREAAAGAPYPRARWLLGGLTMGMLPWAKLQSAPFAALLAGWGTWLAWRRADLPFARRCREVGVLALAALSPAGVFLAMVVTTGQWEHFYGSFIAGNIEYVANDYALGPVIADFCRLSRDTYSLPAFLLGPALAIVAATTILGRARRKPGALFWTGLIFTLVAFLVVLAPRQAFPHYLLFLVLPVTWWGAAALGEGLAILDTAAKRLAFLVAFSVVGAGVPVLARLRLPAPFMFGLFKQSWQYPYNEEARLIRQFRRPGDRLAVWGWNSEIYVQTRLAQATRDAVNGRLLWESARRESYYRPRFMSDLRASRPAFFCDATGPQAFIFTDRARWSHETFAELRDYVRENYVLLQDFPNCRIYLRKDRAPAGTAPNP